MTELPTHRSSTNSSEAEGIPRPHTSHTLAKHVRAAPDCNSIDFVRAPALKSIYTAHRSLAAHSSFALRKGNIRSFFAHSHLAVVVVIVVVFAVGVDVVGLFSSSQITMFLNILNFPFLYVYYQRCRDRTNIIGTARPSIAFSIPATTVRFVINSRFLKIYQCCELFSS